MKLKLVDNLDENTQLLENDKNVYKFLVEDARLDEIFVNIVGKITSLFSITWPFVPIYDNKKEIMASGSSVKALFPRFCLIGAVCPPSPAAKPSTQAAPRANG